VKSVELMPPPLNDMKKSLLISGLISLLIISNTTATEKETAAQEAAAETAAAIPSDGEQGLVETLKASGYTVFAELVEMTGVLRELKEGEPFTCFAPRNEAFNMKIFNKLKEEPDNQELLDLVRYHLLQGDQPKDLILISRRERTLNGKFLLYWITKGEISINNHSELIEADIKTKGGLIHGVSQILRPDVEGAIP
jgi:uncharacterized surface protein with fasciclin (FAS1) repeats